MGMIHHAAEGGWLKNGLNIIHVNLYSPRRTIKEYILYAQLGQWRMKLDLHRYGYTLAPWYKLIINDFKVFKVSK